MKAWEFFYRQAGWSYDPRTQSPIVGRLLGADKLARAEEWAQSIKAQYEWSDDDTPADCQEDDGSWRTYPAAVCVMFIPCVDCAHRPSVDECSRKRWFHAGGSLGGIVESSDYQTARDYWRVIEAELALEAMP